MTLRMNNHHSSRHLLPGSCPQGVYLGVFVFLVAFKGAFLRPEIERNILADSLEEDSSNVASNVSEQVVDKQGDDDTRFTAKFIDDSSHATVVDLEEDLEENTSTTFPLNFYERTKHKLKDEKNLMQQDIDSFIDFTRRRNFTINKIKSSVIRFNSCQKRDYFPSVKVENEVIQVVSKAKILGIWIEESLRWDSHIDHLCERARKRIWILRRMMNLGIDYFTIVDVFKKEIRSILEYNSVVFHSGLTTKQSDRIENIQRYFLRSLSFHLNVKFSYSEARIFFECDLLSSRRQDQCYSFVKKHLVRSERGLLECLFKKRPTHSKRTKKNILFEPQYRSKRAFSNPLSYLTRIGNDILTHQC